MERRNVVTDWRSALCALVAAGIYFIPWLILQARWPIFVPATEQRYPAVGVVLGIGLGGLFALVLLLVVAVPRLMDRIGLDDLARTWETSARSAAWIGLALIALHVGMRLPLPGAFQGIVTVALFLVGALALHRLSG